MSGVYQTYAGRRVSRPWLIVLRAADQAGVRFNVTSGHRTFAEQTALYRLYRQGRGNLAAAPAHTAPHIRTGRIDHAIDVNALDGGADRLVSWLRRQGVRATKPVRGEAWHIEAPAADLERLAGRLALPPLTAGEREHAANLLARRRTAARHNGWSRVADEHLRSANRSNAWIAKRIGYLRDLRRPTADQTARLRYLRDVHHHRLT